MKARKKFHLLQGITAIRVKMGITQQRLAEYLGVSKSLVSMVENGRRRFPFHAFMCLAKLEAAFQNGEIQLPDATVFKRPDQQECPYQCAIRKARERKKEIALEECRFKLMMMEMKYEELMDQLRHLRTVQQFDPGSFDGRRLEPGIKQLMKKLKSCDIQAQAVIRGKMAMLEIIVASFEKEVTEEEKMESIHTNQLIKEEIQAVPVKMNKVPAELPAGSQVIRTVTTCKSAERCRHPDTFDLLVPVAVARHNVSFIEQVKEEARAA